MCISSFQYVKKKKKPLFWLLLSLHFGHYTPKLRCRYYYCHDDRYCFLIALGSLHLSVASFIYDTNAMPSMGPGLILMPLVMIHNLAY